MPTLKEQGINVEIGNWRGVYAAPGITAEQQKVLVDLVTQMFKSKPGVDAMALNKWTPAFMAGPEFAKFVDAEFASLRDVMTKAGMVS